MYDVLFIVFTLFTRRLLAPPQIDTNFIDFTLFRASKVQFAFPHLKWNEPTQTLVGVPFFFPYYVFQTGFQTLILDIFRSLSTRGNLSVFVSPLTGCDAV